jgi:hypothetical protein
VGGVHPTTWLGEWVQCACRAGPGRRGGWPELPRVGGSQYIYIYIYIYMMLFVSHICNVMDNEFTLYLFKSNHNQIPH